MNYTDFSDYLKNTLLLSAEAKSFYLEKGRNYPPEILKKIVEIIQKNEQEMLEWAKTKALKKRKAQTEVQVQKQKTQDQEHLKEAKKAEKNLEKELKTIFTS